MRSDCPILDDSEGITLRSLGGVFICTLFGLFIAMVVLVIEVLNMKKAEKNKVQKLVENWKGKCVSNAQDRRQTDVFMQSNLANDVHFISLCTKGDGKEKLSPGFNTGPRNVMVGGTVFNVREATHTTHS